MSRIPVIDTKLDLRDDAEGRDLDQHSPTLRLYHQILWTKPRPSGVMFELDASRRNAYLVHTSAGQTHFLASDSIIRTFNNMVRMQPIVSQIPDRQREALNRQGYSIGGITLFPGNRVDGRSTINGARGMHPKIADRFDLTLECIRRHYADESSPLTGALARYPQFFDLFDDFRGYVEFFLFNDLVDETASEVRFFAPFDDFASSPLPQSVEDYLRFRAETLAFVRGRNERIAGYVNSIA